jgi:hypothetical protein
MSNQRHDAYARQDNDSHMVLHNEPLGARVPTTERSGACVRWSRPFFALGTIRFLCDCHCSKTGMAKIQKMGDLSSITGPVHYGEIPLCWVLSLQQPLTAIAIMLAHRSATTDSGSRAERLNPRDHRSEAFSLDEVWE